MTDADLERDLALCAAATAPPWDWYGNTKTHEVYLATVDRGRVYVMDFDRWGMSSGQPRFQIDHIMRRLGDLGKEEHPLGPIFEAPHRRQFRGIGHPDAKLIVAACNGYAAALREVQRLRAEAIAPRLNPGPTLHGSTITEIAAERDHLRADLRAATQLAEEFRAVAEEFRTAAVKFEDAAVVAFERGSQSQRDAFARAGFGIEEIKRLDAVTEKLRADLAAMTAARDAACVMASDLNGDNGDDEMLQEVTDRVAALQAVGKEHP